MKTRTSAKAPSPDVLSTRGAYSGNHSSRGYEGARRRQFMSVAGVAMKKLIVFDLDGTIAESKSAVDAEMSALLRELLKIVKVAIISGGNWPQFERQLVSNLPRDAPLKNLSLLPTCGTKFYKYSSTWEKLYSEDFTNEEKDKDFQRIGEGDQLVRCQRQKGVGRAD